MTLLACLLPLLVALLTTPQIVRTLKSQALVKENFHGREVAFPAGIAIPIATAVALAPLALLTRLTDSELLSHLLPPVLIYGFGMALFGLVDDLLDASPRGLRGHGNEILKGGFSTGIIKAVTALGLALYLLIDFDQTLIKSLLAAAVVVLTTNLFNLLDLRPGRAIKVSLLTVGIGSLAATSTLALAAVGPLLAPFLVFFAYDLNEQAMLGDVGSNLLGGLVGFWLVLTLPTVGQIIALVVLLFVTIYGEFRSISALIEKTPPLLWLDSLGRKDA